jgi:hypothetical protein
VADDMMTRIGAAVELGRAGDKAGASRALAALWDEIGDDGDAFHRCALAHYIADVQDDLQSELEWDERALVAVRSVSDARAQEHYESLRVRAFMPSLFLNLADDHRRLGSADRAREYLEQARNSAGALGDDDYGVMIEGAITTVAKALAEGSTAPLPTH